MKIERRRRAFVAPTKFGVAPVADRHFFQPAVDDQIDERCERQDAVRDQIALEPVEDCAD